MSDNLSVSLDGTRCRSYGICVSVMLLIRTETARRPAAEAAAMPAGRV